MNYIRLATVWSGEAINEIKAAMTSFRLWLGNEQAIPTAMPEEPLTLSLIHI